jgi:hypothetical protein
MRAIKLIALLSIAVPTLAVAQVGPNPAANGSLDPTVGKTGDTLTAPADAPVGPAGPESSASDAATDVDNTTDATNSTTDAPDAADAAKKSTAPMSESKRKPR